MTPAKVSLKLSTFIKPGCDFIHSLSSDRLEVILLACSGVINASVIFTQVSSPFIEIIASGGAGLHKISTLMPMNSFKL